MGLSFPSSLTDEEKLLQHKYAQLKRKKNQINSLKNPKVETPPAPVIPPVIKRPLPSDSGSKADAKEVAKKLLKSGAITAIKVPEKKDTGFVRKRTLSSRVGDKPGGYRPFSASTSVDEEDDVFVSSIPSDPNPAPDYSAKYNSLSSSSYVSPKDAEVIAREETMREKKREGKQHYVNRDLPNQGNTIYIRAPGMTEMSLKRAFSPHGTIGAICVESEKNCAFITFETIEEANRAIDSVNGTIIDGNEVHVSLARKQLRMQSSLSSSSSSFNTPSVSSKQPVPSSTPAASKSWGNLAANYFKEDKDSTKKNPNKFKREVVSYEDISDF